MNQWRDSIAGLADPGEIDWERITLDNLAGDWNEPPDNPPKVLIAHSGCERRIRPEHAGPLAQRLEQVLGRPGPLALELTRGWTLESFVQATRRFSKGLMLASTSGEDLEFHQGT